MSTTSKASDPNETRPTAGEWSVVENADLESGGNAASIYAGKRTYIADVYCGYVGSEDMPREEQRANARLIADAGTTYHKTGKMPSEIAEALDTMQRQYAETIDAYVQQGLTIKRLMDALSTASNHIASLGHPQDRHGNYDKDGEWTFHAATERDADAEELKAAFLVIRSALTQPPAADLLGITKD